MDFREKTPGGWRVATGFVPALALTGAMTRMAAHLWRKIGLNVCSVRGLNSRAADGMVLVRVQITMKPDEAISSPAKYYYRDRVDLCFSRSEKRNLGHPNS